MTPSKGSATPRKTFEELMAENPPKPRTTVKRFAADLKTRLERAAKCFDDGATTTPNSADVASGLRHAIGVVEAALSDYDVRDPEDFMHRNRRRP